ncbi:hypothetical protein [Siphonobacter sp. SORGH_AS_0500]|uniref:hypothetical protein n=1 Tax=Siphonobacter sp. SORGH_AS_0500 TaxID=1864824 RepID=UPI00286052BB|nr:hypothetical protein [Siphonobacter sp. SORGH_AS_0500]MDR6194710.1 hypothetical protein [Siphonobacter sp. SORGH_AS_0500]
MGKKIKFVNKGKSNTFLVPESWQECKPEQLRKLAPFNMLREELRNRQIWEHVVQIMLRCKPNFWKKLVMSLDEWWWLKEQCKWIFEVPLQQQPFAFFTIKGVNYHLPAPAYGNTSALELALANIAFTEYAHPDEPKKEALDQLIFILCRPERKNLKKFRASNDWNGDVREPFNEAKMLDRSRRLALPLDDKIAILNYFVQMNNGFLEMYPEFFGKSGKKEPRYKDGRGWVLMLKNVAKEGGFGDFDKVCEMPVHLLWASLLDDFITNEELQAEAEKQYQ